MLAGWLENSAGKPGVIVTRQVENPVPGPDEALVQVLLAGVCSTDLELLRGYYPFEGIPGHEFVGRVIECPSDQSWIGRRVVGEINISCGKCYMCNLGYPTHCERRRAVGINGHAGAFAERLTIPVRNLHAVPGSVSNESAVFTEPLAAALEIQTQVQITERSNVLVIGAGRLGQLIAQTLAVTGCTLAVMARHPRQRALLQDRNLLALPAEADLSPIYDVVIEATGTPEGFDRARQAVRPRGTLVLKSTYKGEMTVNFSALVVDEITLVGSRCGPFEAALQLLESGKVEPRPMIEMTYPLEQVALAIQHAARPGAMKVLIDPQGTA